MTDDAKPPQRNLSALRTRITALDGTLIKLLAERRGISLDVARTKAADGRSVRDPVREEALLETLIQRGRAEGLDALYVTRVFHTIIDDSVRAQHTLLLSGGGAQDDGPGKISIAFQGDKGSYSHVAIGRHFAGQPNKIIYLGYENFAEVVQAVEDGTSDYAMLPIENTTSGGINEVYDLLMHTSLSVIGEHTLQINHCLLGTAGASISSLKTVYAHPQGFAQCSEFVRGLTDCERVSVETAQAVKRAAADSSGQSAAIASEQAGEQAGLQVLQGGIANQTANYTRFLLVSREARRVPTQIASKTSLVMATLHEPGSLVEALQLFRSHNINITKLESRPIIGNPWEEIFYLDLEGNIESESVAEAIRQLGTRTRFLKVLGSYPAADLPATRVRPEALAGTAAQPTRKVTADPPAEEPDATRTPRRVVRTRGLSVGGDQFVVAAGPSPSGSVDAAHALGAVTHTVAEFGAGIVRMRLPAQLQDASLDNVLRRYREMADAVGVALMVATHNSQQTLAAGRRADFVLLEPDAMHNRDTLRAAGRIHCPVIITRAPLASLPALLSAAQSVEAEGNRQLMLCESGVNIGDASGALALDLALIPTIHAQLGMPVWVDPGPASNNPQAILALACAAQAAGADGVLLDVSDNRRDTTTLDNEQFAHLMSRLYPRAPSESA